MSATDRSHRHPTLVVRSRYGTIALVGVAGALVALGMFILRQDDLEFDDLMETGVVLALGLWLSTQAIGLVARRLEAGHALKIDARGLHHPGWEVVPWSAIRGAWLQRSKKIGWHQRDDLMLDIDPSCRAPAAGNYVRWMFGPIEGLWPRGKPIRIPLVGLAIAPDALLAAIESARRQAGIDANALHRHAP